MNRKLSVGDTLSKIFSTYGDQAGVLLPVAFVLYLAVAILNGLVLGGGLILLALYFVVYLVASTLYQGMVVGLVSDVQDGKRDSTVGDLIDATWPVVVPLIVAGFLAGIAIAIGFIILIVPGLILITIWAVLAPVIVVEHSGALEAFGRSRQLVKGNGWQVFGVIVVVFLIVGVANAILGAIGNGISDSLFMQILFSLIASTLTAPVAALSAATIYFGLMELRHAEPAPGAAAPGDQPPPSAPPPVSV